MSTTQNKRFDNNLVVNDEAYDITAVYSDEAGKVTNALEINKQVDFDSTLPGINADTVSGMMSEFDGSVPGSVTIVPAEGGAFTGPVMFKRFQELGLTEDEAQNLAVNRADITKLLSDLTGCPCYRWDGETLTPITYVRPGAGQTGTTAASGSSEQTENVFALFNIVIGSETFLDELVVHPDCPQAYLYLCVDETDHSGHLYIGGASLTFLATNPVQLVMNTAHADTADEAATADSADSAAVADNAYYLISDTVDASISYDELMQKLSNLQGSINDITKSDGSIADRISTHNNNKAAHSYILNCMRRILFGDSVSALTSSIPDPGKTGISGTTFHVYDSDRLGSKTPEHYQGKIFIGTADERDAQIAALRGPAGVQNNDIWIKIGD